MLSMRGYENETPDFTLDRFSDDQTIEPSSSVEGTEFPKDCYPDVSTKSS